MTSIKESWNRFSLKGKLPGPSANLFSREDYKEFQVVVLKDDIVSAKVQKQYDELHTSKEKQKGFVLTYLIKNPKTSKSYQIWEIIWFFVLILEFCLVPYT